MIIYFFAGKQLAGIEKEVIIAQCYSGFVAIGFAVLETGTRKISPAHESYQEGRRLP